MFQLSEIVVKKLLITISQVTRETEKSYIVFLEKYVGKS